MSAVFFDSRIIHRGSPISKDKLKDVKYFRGKYEAKVPKDKDKYTIYCQFGSSQSVDSYMYDRLRRGNNSKELKRWLEEMEFISKFDIELSNLSTTLHGSTNAYPISNTEIQNISINITCSTFTTNKVIFAGNGIAVLFTNDSNTNAPGTPIYKEITNVYHDIYALRDDLIIAVGNNVISYSEDEGVTWTTINISDTSLINNKHNISNIVLKNVHAVDNRIVVVGENGIFAYSDNGPGKDNWKIVPDSMLNSSGIAERINGSNNDLFHVYMKDIESIIISKVYEKQYNDEVDNSNDRPGITKILHVFIPPLFNRLQNKVLDISGNINIVGDMDILDGDLSVTKRLFANYIDSNDDETTITTTTFRERGQAQGW